MTGVLPDDLQCVAKTYYPSKFAKFPDTMRLTELDAILAATRGEYQAPETAPDPTTKQGGK